MANFYCNFHCIITLKQIFPIFLALSFRFTQIIQLKKFVNGLTHKNFSLEKYSRCGRNRYYNCILLSARVAAVLILPDTTDTRIDYCVYFYRVYTVTYDVSHTPSCSSTAKAWSVGQTIPLRHLLSTIFLAIINFNYQQSTLVIHFIG